MQASDATNNRKYRNVWSRVSCTPPIYDRILTCHLLVQRVSLLVVQYIINGLTLFLHGVCMLREHGECAHEQHVRRTLTLTHTITAYSVSGNVVRVRVLVCATRQTPCRKRVYLINACHHMCAVRGGYRGGSRADPRAGPGTDPGTDSGGGERGECIPGHRLWGRKALKLTQWVRGESQAAKRILVHFSSKCPHFAADNRRLFGSRRQNHHSILETQSYWHPIKLSLASSTVVFSVPTCNWTRMHKQKHLHQQLQCWLSIYKYTSMTIYRVCHVVRPPNFASAVEASCAHWVMRSRCQLCESVQHVCPNLHQGLSPWTSLGLRPQTPVLPNQQLVDTPLRAADSDVKVGSVNRS